MLQLQRISAPTWAFEPLIDYDKAGGMESRQAFQPYLPQILKLVHERMEQFVNDTEFYRLDELGEEEDPMAFPETSRLTGAYYLASERYERQERHGISYYQLVVTFHFLYPSPITQTNDDYFSLEAWVRIWCDTQDIELMPGLTYAAI